VFGDYPLIGAQFLGCSTRALRESSRLRNFKPFQEWSKSGWDSLKNENFALKLIYASHIMAASICPNTHMGKYLPAIAKISAPERTNDFFGVEKTR